MIRYEEKSLNAWPSLKTLVYKGCIIRLSRGYTKRANSANPLYTEENQIDDIIKYCENTYISAKQPSVFKIVNINSKYDKIDSRLQKLNYKKLDLTNVMLKELSSINTIEENLIDFESDNKFSKEWIKSFIVINNIKEKDKLTAIQMLDSITVGLLVASIKVNNKIIACGYGAFENNSIGFYDIVVANEYRGQGYGKKLMSGLINKAKESNIKNAYLQVVASNLIANKLYEDLGFYKIYNYWYRVK